MTVVGEKKVKVEVNNPAALPIVRGSNTRSNFKHNFQIGWLRTLPVTTSTPEGK